MKNKIRTLLSFAVMFAMIGSYFVSPNLAQVEASAKKLKVTVPAKTIAVNTSITLKTNVKAKFKSSNKKIATVSSKGVVKGKKSGKVTITVTSKSNKNQKKTVKITVKNQLVITAPEGAKATLQVGETTKIKTNLSSTYVSSDSKIATVKSNGTVTAKAEGKATITVTSKIYKKLKKKISITVTKSKKQTTESTTESTTTVEPTSSDTVKPADNPTTETPTDQQSSQVSTTEIPTAEVPTAEEPTTEIPTADKPTLVGIEAKYRGEKIPKGSDIKWQGVIITEKYSDGTNSEIDISNFKKIPIISETYTISTEGEKEYYTYTVTYYQKTAPLKVEVVDVGDILYPIQFMAIYEGETIKDGDIPKIEDISTSIVLSDYTQSDDVDTSKLEITFWNYTETHGIAYYVTFHYTFTDEISNELYVCVSRMMIVPYE